MEFSIDLFYSIDIVIGFMTSFIDPFTGDEYYGCSSIAKHYLKHDFPIDFLSTFPFQEFFAAFGISGVSLTFLFKCLSLLKVLRLRKVDKLIRGANTSI